jgi:hypothetical protein
MLRNLHANVLLLGLLPEFILAGRAHRNSSSVNWLGTGGMGGVEPIIGFKVGSL